MALPVLIFVPFKLDAGSEERIMLVSRDEQSCLVVSFKDVKMIIESAFKYVPFGLVGFVQLLHTDTCCVS